MSRSTTEAAGVDLGAVDRERLAGWLAERRWFGSKSRRIATLEPLDAPVIDPGPPASVIALVEVHFEAGPAEIYQLPLTISGDGEPHDLVGDRRGARALLERIVAGGEVGGAAGELSFRWSGSGPPPPAGAEARPIAGEQSNSSTIFGENAILKVYRRLEAGTNPELEILEFLDRRGFRQIPALLGWYEYRGATLAAGLGILQEFVADGRDGWELTLDGLAGDPERLLGPLRELGSTLGAMHTTLACDSDDPAFAPEDRGARDLDRLIDDLGREIDRAFAELPADERVAPIAGRGTELRERLRGLAGAADAGRAIRIHGDLHLGQTLHSDRGWTLLDFEGEPARTLAERRAKQSPLRDVAGMLRSLAYAPLAARLQRDAEPPADWEARARESFLDGYLDSVDPSLLPATRPEIDRLLAIYELEKAVYELTYELDNRPDWVAIPVAGITRLLEVQTR
jgi:maltokinase